MKHLLTLTALLFLLQHATAQTVQHVSLVYNINANSSSDPAHLTVFNNQLYFCANNGTSGRELWSYNGTGNPAMIANVHTGSADGAGLWSWAAHNAVIGDRMYYMGSNDSSGWELFYCDTANNIGIAADINPNGSSTPYSYLAYNDILYFFATTPAYGYELWKYDPATSAATRLSDIRPGAADGIAAPTEPLIAFNGKLYFAGADNLHGEELFSYDPANGNVALAFDINADTAASSPRSFITGGGRLYFSAKTTTNGRELYRYNGVDTPMRVTDNIPGWLDGVYPAAMAWYDSSLIFAGATTATGWELFRFDTATQQASLIADLYPGAANSGPAQFTVMDSVLYFAAAHSTLGQELWRYNGTGNPALVQDILTGPNGSDPVCLTAFNNKLYMNANNGSSGYELFVLDTITINPGGVQPVFSDRAAVYPNPAQSEVNFRTAAPVTLYITDITGKQLLERRLSQGISTVNMNEYAPGFYLYRLQYNDGTVQQGKIVRR